MTSVWYASNRTPQFAQPLAARACYALSNDRLGTPLAQGHAGIAAHARSCRLGRRGHRSRRCSTSLARPGQPGASATCRGRPASGPFISHERFGTRAIHPAVARAGRRSASGGAALRPARQARRLDAIVDAADAPPLKRGAMRRTARHGGLLFLAADAAAGTGACRASRSRSPAWTADRNAPTSWPSSASSATRTVRTSTRTLMIGLFNRIDREVRGALRPLATTNRGQVRLTGRTARLAHQDRHRARHPGDAGIRGPS